MISASRAIGYAIVIGLALVAALFAHWAEKAWGGRPGQHFSFFWVLFFLTMLFLLQGISWVFHGG